MGYTTEFEGAFKLNKPLDETTLRKLLQLHDRRHDDYAWLGMSGMNCFPMKPWEL